MDVEEIFQTSVMLDSDGKSQLLELDKDSYGMLTSAEYITDDAETVTIHLANADIRDVISAIVLVRLQCCLLERQGYC